MLSIGIPTGTLCVKSSLGIPGCSILSSARINCIQHASMHFAWRWKWSLAIIETSSIGFTEGLYKIWVHTLTVCNLTLTHQSHTQEGASSRASRSHAVALKQVASAETSVQP